MADDVTRGKVKFDLDAFARRLERQQVIEFSDVAFLIKIVRDGQARTGLAERLVADFEALAQRHDKERNQAFGRAERAEQAAAHFYHCRQCTEGSPCEEGERYARALGLMRE